MTVCPKNNAKGLAEGHDVSTEEYIWAMVVTQVNLVLQVITTKVYRKMKNMTVETTLMWNIVIYLLFTLLFAVLIIKMRLYILFEHP